MSLLLLGAGSSGGVSGPPSAPVPDFWLIGDTPHYQDAGRTTPATATNDPVGSATDSATTGPWHPSQATAGNRPLLAKAYWKGHDVLRFTSASMTLANTLAALTANCTKCTVVLVFRLDDTTTVGAHTFYHTSQIQIGLLGSAPKVTFNFTGGAYGQLDAGSYAFATNLGGQVLTIVYDGTLTGNSNRLKCFRNGVQEPLTFTGTVGASCNALTGCTIGGNVPETVAEIVVFRNVAFTTPQFLQWDAWEALKYFTKTTKALVVSGDSNAVGSPSNVGNSWVDRVYAAKGWTGGLNNNSAVGALLSSEALSPLGLVDRDDYQVVQPYLIARGTNDIGVNSDSVATMQGYINTLKTKLTYARFPIFVVSVPMAGNYSGAQETTRAAYNTWLSTLPGITYVDIATPLGDPNGGGAANFVDGVHFTTGGHDIVKNTVLAAFTAAGY